MSKHKLSWYRVWVPYVMLIPTMIGLLIFRLGPLLGSLAISFTDWNMLTSATFVGLANYKEMFHNPSFIQTAKNTFIFSLIYVLGVMFLGLSLALLLNKKAKGIGFFVGHSFRPLSLQR